MDAVDAIKRGFELFNRRDWDAIARGLPDDFEAVDRAPVDVLRARGPYALRTITDANGDTAFADLRMDVVDGFTVEPSKDVVLVVVRVAASGTGGASGARVEGEIGQIWTVENGVIKRLEQFPSWDEASRAAKG
jgi:ketosteroid isomerase-like protein